MSQPFFATLFARYRNNKILSNTLVYTIAGGLNAAIPFFILPILTAYLTPVEYGVVSTFMVFNSIFLIIIGVEQYSYISVNFYTKTLDEIRVYISNIIASSFLIFIFFIIGMALVSFSFESLSQVKTQWIIFSVVVAFFQFLSQMGLTIWQLSNEAFRYGIFQVLNSFVNYSLSIFLIINFGWGEAGRIWGITIAAFIFGSYSLYHLRKSNFIAWDIDIKVIKNSLIFSLPLVPHAFAGWINTASDRLIINNFIGVAETGIYSIYFQIAMVISLLAGSFNRAFIPFVFKTLGENPEGGKIRLVRYTYYYFVILITLAIFLALASTTILNILVDEQYHQSTNVIYWIIAGFTADGLYYGVINYLFYAKKTSHVAMITFSSSIIHFAASILLIPRLGVMGAAYSTAISYIFSFVMAWYVSNRVFPMPWTFFLKQESQL